MQIKIFDVTSVSLEELDALNRFLRSHRILDIDRRFYYTENKMAHWSVCVTYLPQPEPNYGYGNNAGAPREKIDYKTVLSEADFAKFSKLRELRKQLSSAEAVPAYAVFTDAELAQIALLPSIDALSVSKISGIGEKRLEKYGKILCERYQETVTEEATSAAPNIMPTL